jgi:hypothetical protein
VPIPSPEQQGPLARPRHQKGGEARRPRSQPRALESASADNPGAGTKRGADNRRAAGRATGVRHGRGETSVGLTNQQKRHSPGSGQHEPGEDRGLNEELAAPTAPPTATAPRVFVLDRHGRPLAPCHPARARKLPGSVRHSSGEQTVKPHFAISRLAVRKVQLVL